MKVLKNTDNDTKKPFLAMLLDVIAFKAKSI